MRQKLLALLILLLPSSIRASEPLRELTVQEVKAKIGHKHVYIFDNNDPEVLTFMSKTFANMVANMAFATDTRSSSTTTSSTTQTATRKAASSRPRAAK